MTKSVISAMVGVLIRQQKLTNDGPALVAAWSDPRDPRPTITIDNLLRMTSGLDVGQSLATEWTTAFGPSSQLDLICPTWRRSPRARLAAPPGSIWKYANGNTLLLSRIIRNRVGGDPGSVIRFACRELFDRLGMAHVTLEFDEAGRPIDSSHIGVGARLGTFRVALCERRRGRRRTRSASWLGKLLGQSHAGQRGLRLRPRLLDQPGNWLGNRRGCEPGC
jgi:CubicO group peptidase (beta-lactamase class C family)